MKLSEVTLKKTHLIFEDETDTRMPEIDTTAEIDGKTYKWRGAMWTEVKPDGSNGRPAPTGIGRQLTAQWRTSTPIPRSGFKFTPGVQQLGDNKWATFLPDQTTMVESASETEARAIQKRVDELSSSNKTPAQVTSTIDKEVRSGGLKGTVNKRFALGRRITNATAETFENVAKAKNSPLIKILQNPVVRIATKAMAVVGPFWGMMIEIVNINQEIDNAPPGTDIQRLKDIRSILQGQIVAYYTAQILLLVRKIGFVKQILKPIKAVIRSGQVAVALTGVGAPASFISLIVTEALWIVVPLILSSSSIQRWIAEVIVDSSFKDIFVLTGRSLESVTSGLAAAVDGKFGTGALAKAISGYDPKETEGVTGEYYGESEWAKLVFGTLLFPPGTKSQLVPYIPEGRREVLLAGIMNLNPVDATEPAADATEPAAGADPSTSSEPGMPTNPDAVPGPQ